MSWHRLVKIPKKENIILHYTLEGYDNAGLTSTLRKEGSDLVLEFSTPLSASFYFDKIIDSVLREIQQRRDVE